MSTVAQKPAGNHTETYAFNSQTAAEFPQMSIHSGHLREYDQHK